MSGPKLFYQNGRLENEFTDQNPIDYGSFGWVISAKNQIDLKMYAIKLIDIKDKRQYPDKIRELQVWAHLDCDYFVQLRSSWVEENPRSAGIILYIQMDLCWFPLQEAIKKLHNYFKMNNKQLLGPLAYYIVSVLMIELVECVNYLHTMETPIIHRDIKPDNILIKYDRTNGRFVKLADFGLAVLHQSKSSEQTHTINTGGVQYMAPEVSLSHPSKDDPLRDTKAKYGTKADVYSIGVLFQEVFNFDLNRSTTDTEPLPLKYPKLEILIESLLRTQSKTRPSCKDILDGREDWAMNLKEVKDEIKAEIDMNRDYNPKEDFILYFLKTKFKLNY